MHFLVNCTAIRLNLKHFIIAASNLEGQRPKAKNGSFVGAKFLVLMSSFRNGAGYPGLKCTSWSIALQYD